MSNIRSRNTGPELAVRHALREAGLVGYRLHYAKAPGRPDIAFVGRRVAVFVHGCFWHQHAHCPAGRIPTGNRPFWESKLARNTQRDTAAKLALQRLGWRVLTVWECETKTPGKLQKRLARLLPPLAPE